MLVIYSALLGIFLVLIFVILFTKIASKSTKLPCKTLIVLGSGGHTRELLGIVKSMNPHLYSPRKYVIAGSDTFSSDKVTTLEAARVGGAYSVIRIFRTREVGQSWFTTVFTALLSLLQSVKVVLLFQPQLIICNGPGLCVPICLVAYICKILGLFEVKTVYVESICRVNSLSLSGKILRFIVDWFFVQWEDLKAVFRSMGRS